MVMRPYQVYAVEALVRQATLTNRNAYVWHTTGAGKTLTSFKTAQILAANPNIKKVIFLVDRKDLDSQTTEEFNKFEAGSVDATDLTAGHGDVHITVQGIITIAAPNDCTGHIITRSTVAVQIDLL